MIFKSNIYETLYKQKTKVFKMDGKFAFLLLFSKHLELKRSANGEEEYQT